jgi:hypothetical protein
MEYGITPVQADSNHRTAALCHVRAQGLQHADEVIPANVLHVRPGKDELKRLAVPFVH